MFRDTGGVVVLYAGTTTWGHFGSPTRVVLEAASGTGGVKVSARQVTVATSVLASVRRGEPITVDGTAYTVVHAATGDHDPGVTDILLGRA